ncbi:unnamed protein product [Calypogeia fissa]
MGPGWPGLPGLSKGKHNSWLPRRKGREGWAQSGLGGETAGGLAWRARRLAPSPSTMWQAVAIFGSPLPVWRQAAGGRRSRGGGGRASRPGLVGSPFGPLRNANFFSKGGSLGLGRREPTRPSPQKDFFCSPGGDPIYRKGKFWTILNRWLCLEHLEE